MAELYPDPENARLHDSSNLDAIRRSLVNHGQDQPIVVQREGMRIRKGNGRFAVATELGWTHIAAVIIDEGDVDASLRSLLDNRASDLGRWDHERLATLVDWLRTEKPEEVGEIFTPAAAAMVQQAAPPQPQRERTTERVPVKSLVLTDDQYEVVCQAVERLKNREGVPDLKIGRAIELICADFLSGG